MDNIKVEIEKLKGRLETVRTGFEVLDNMEDNRRNYTELVEAWTKLQKLVKHPYKMLYKTEQLFWKAVRVNFGNISLRN